MGGTAPTPLAQVRAVLNACANALWEQAFGITLGYIALGATASLMLVLLNGVSAGHVSGDRSARILKAVLEKVQDQAARFVVTFKVGFLVFTLSLSLRETGTQMQPLMWLRVFPTLGFAIVQVASLIRWRLFLLEEFRLCHPAVIDRPPSTV